MTEDARQALPEPTEATTADRESGERLERKPQSIGCGFVLFHFYIVSPIVGWIVYPLGAQLFGKPWPYIFIAILVGIVSWGWIRPHSGK